MVYFRSFAFLPALITVSRAQQACSSTAETHPALNWSKCTSSGCTEVEGSVVVDSNWRWTHTVSGSTNCYTGNEWDSSICTDGETCAEKCCVDGADYASTYGVTTSGNQLSIDFVTKGAYSTNIGSRLYLLEDDSTYQMFTLLGNEFTFDVDVSAISCGLNGALYFVSMDEDGGMAKNSGNKAGAKYGTGYCDAQCARDVKFINGVANVEGWTPSSSDPNSGTGNLGTCCPEMDIWEANDISTAFTPHPCKTLTQHSCEGDNCGGTYSAKRYAGTCDPDGCDFNAFRQGNESFYGPGSIVDTKKKVTVVTQFIKGTDGGLSEIKRFYVQNGKVIANADSEVAGTSGNSVNKDFCTAQKVAFGDDDDFEAKGGFSGMSDALAAPMVLVMSLWDDHHANMLWLDSTYPEDKTGAGAKRGTCATDSGVPADVEADAPDSSVVFSNIKFGPIGSTFDSSSSDPGQDTGDKETTTPISSAANTLQTSVKSTAAETQPTTKSQSSAAAVVSTSSVREEEEPKTTGAASLTTTAGIKSDAQSPTTPALPGTSNTAGESQCGDSTVTVTVTASVSFPGTPSSGSTPSPTSANPDDEDDDGDEDDDECEDDTEEGTSNAAAYHQCGGTGWTGATTCASGYVCKEQNAYYSQCVEQ